jgi:hypothetical protein
LIIQYNFKKIKVEDFSLSSHYRDTWNRTILRFHYLYRCKALSGIITDRNFLYSSWWWKTMLEFCVISWLMDMQMVSFHSTYLVNNHKFRCNAIYFHHFNSITDSWSPLLPWFETVLGLELGLVLGLCLISTNNCCVDS